MKVCITDRMMLAIASLLCAAFLVHSNFAQELAPWEGHIAHVEDLDAGRMPSSSDPPCAALGARIYTIETGQQVFKMFGNLVEDPSNKEGKVHFFIDDKRSAHFEDPYGSVMQQRLVVYYAEWTEVAAKKEASPVKRLPRDWRDAKLIGVQPTLDLWTTQPDTPFQERPCTISRPVGWVYILDVDGVTYDGMWKEEAPLQLRVNEHTPIAWRGPDRIYLIDNDKNVRTLAVKKRTQPTSEQAPRYSSSKTDDSAAPANKPHQGDKDSATKNALDQPAWDPLRAENDLEVGQHYMHKGDYDAAIDRFQDAIEAKPGYAIPFRYLGEAQEKKGLRKQAIKSYQRYLDLYPHAEDAEKIKKKVEKLWKEAEKKQKD